MWQETVLADWNAKESLAEAMVPLIGRLYRERNVEISIYRRILVKRSVIDILKTHRFVRQVEGEELSVVDTFPILTAVSQMNLINAQVDIGKLAVNYRHVQQSLSLDAYLRQELAGALDKVDERSPVDVVLYGFGRIGRILARQFIDRPGVGHSLRLKAIVVRKGKADNDLEKRASLLRRDSVHGSFKGTIQVDQENQCLVANGLSIKVIFANQPEDIDYEKYGIKQALVIDNTGMFRDYEGMSRHLHCKGVARAILTAPGKQMKNVVMGVNHHAVTAEDVIVSAASCTTNAIVPVLKALNEKFGIENGHVETVHSYTNDQNLIDNYHKGSRRGRAAALNMVLTETGAAKAVAKALPELEGKLTGNAIRVPTPNVSMAILNLNLRVATTKDALNDYLRYTALHSDLQKQVDFSNSPEAVSSDFVGSRAAGVVDALATIVAENRCVVYVWYDNEYGYSCQVVRLARSVMDCALISYPLEP